MKALRDMYIPEEVQTQWDLSRWTVYYSILAFWGAVHSIDFIL